MGDRGGGGGGAQERARVSKESRFQDEVGRVASRCRFGCRLEVLGAHSDRLGVEFGREESSSYSAGGAVFQ